MPSSDRSPRLEGGSFSRHARRRRPRCVLKAQSAPENELRRHMIPSGREPTRRTLMPALAQCVRDVGTAEAVLRGAARIDLHQHAPGALVREFLDERRPPGIVNSPAFADLGRLTLLMILSKFTQSNERGGQPGV